MLAGVNCAAHTRLCQGCCSMALRGVVRHRCLLRRRRTPPQPRGRGCRPAPPAGRPAAPRTSRSQQTARRRCRRSCRRPLAAATPAADRVESHVWLTVARSDERARGTGPYGSCAGDDQCCCRPLLPAVPCGRAQAAQRHCAYRQPNAQLPHGDENAPAGLLATKTGQAPPAPAPRPRRRQPGCGGAG